MSRAKEKPSRKTKYGTAAAAVMTAVVLVLGLFGVHIPTGEQTTITTIAVGIVGIIVNLVHHFTRD